MEEEEEEEEESIRSKLSKLLPGDIFHAQCPSGASLICVVEQMTKDTIDTRRITTQDHESFDLETGRTISDGPPCTIDSIAPLPIETLHVLLGLERKMRLRFEKLSREERDALVFVASFYPAHPL